jgi:hypothetical protein
MYTDYYLRFQDEAEAKATLYHIEGAVEADEEMGIEASEGYEVANYKNIDVLGVLYEKQDIVDPENPPEPIPLEGFHVNVRVMPDENGEPLEAFKVNPEPMVWRRVWGD